MAKNVVIFGGTTLIDLTPTTATETDVAQGKVFFKADGTQATGTASGGGASTSTPRKLTLEHTLTTTLTQQ